MVRLRIPTAATLASLAWLCSPSACGARVVDLAEHAVPTIVGSHAEEQFGYSSAAGDPRRRRGRRR